MIKFRPRSIKQRLLIILMLVAVISLVVFAALISAVDRTEARKQLLRDMNALSGIIAAKGSDAVRNRHEADARDALNPLQAQPLVLNAVLYRTGGIPVAVYSKNRALPFNPPRITGEAHSSFSGFALEYFKPLIVNDQRVGTLYIRADTGGIKARQRRLLLALAAVFVLVLGVAAILSMLLQRVVTDPISRLSSTVRRVALEDDITIRSELDREDELGKLARGFNTMLENIQQRDEKLQRINGELEQRVEERTGKLLEEISERKLAEKRLNQTGRQYQQLVETSSGLIWSVDAEGKWTFLNKMATHLIYRCEPEELTGSHFTLMSAPECIQADVRMMTNLVSGRPIFSYETVHHRKDGTPVHLTFNAVTLYNDRNEILGATGTATDVTARNEAIRREQDLHGRLARAERMEALGLLAGGVAHDLNNILGPIVAYPDLIQAELPSDSPACEDLEEIKKSAGRAAAVIQDLLTLSRRGGYQTEPLFLQDVVEDFLGSASYKEKRKLYPDIAVEKDFSRNPLPIEGSAPHLSQVIMNLIINALEAMDKQGKLTVRLYDELVTEAIGDDDEVEPGRYVVLNVSDTGPGIGPKNLEKIFEPFYSDKKMGCSGTGLGLAVVYGVVKDLKGYIDIRTELGRGTDFLLYFPVSDKLPEKPIKGPQNFSGSESILVVDDLPEQRNLARRVLENMGYRVETVPDGREAIAWLLGNRADLAIIDMVMEDDFDGLDTFVEIQALGLDVPCIIASGFSENGRVKEALNRGVSKYVKKPYTPAEMGKTIRDTLDTAVVELKSGPA